MSTTSCGEDNVRPVSHVQPIFSDPEALNLLQHTFNCLHTKMVSTERPRLQALLRTPTLPERPRLTRQMRMTTRIPRRLKGQKGWKTTLMR